MNISVQEANLSLFKIHVEDSTSIAQVHHIR